MGRSASHGLFRRDLPAPHVEGIPGTTKKNTNACEARLIGKGSIPMWESG